MTSEASGTDRAIGGAVVGVKERISQRVRGTDCGWSRGSIGKALKGLAIHHCRRASSDESPDAGSDSWMLRPREARIWA